jgi:hypothetical protein
MADRSQPRIKRQFAKTLWKKLEDIGRFRNLSPQWLEIDQNNILKK